MLSSSVWVLLFVAGLAAAGKGVNEIKKPTSLLLEEVRSINCTVEETWEEDCNKCKCVEDGVAICTMMTCGESRRKRQAGGCTPGTSRQVDCNTCTCLRGGVEACTRKFCLPSRQPSRPSSSGGSRPGRFGSSSGRFGSQFSSRFPSRFQSRFPSRSRFGSSRFQSRLRRELPRIFPISQETGEGSGVPPSLDYHRNETCTPGETWSKGCNKCGCVDGEDGWRMALCTAKTCGVSRQKRQAGGSCTPGVSRQVECNTCTCTDRGYEACTLKGCLSSQQSSRPASSGGFESQFPGRFGSGFQSSFPSRFGSSSFQSRFGSRSQSRFGSRSQSRFGSGFQPRLPRQTGGDSDAQCARVCPADCSERQDVNGCLICCEDPQPFNYRPEPPSPENMLGTGVYRVFQALQEHDRSGSDRSSTTTYRQQPYGRSGYEGNAATSYRQQYGRSESDGRSGMTYGQQPYSRSGSDSNAAAPYGQQHGQADRDGWTSIPGK